MNLFLVFIVFNTQGLVVRELDFARYLQIMREDNANKALSILALLKKFISSN
jgi:hypothetical protein